MRLMLTMALLGGSVACSGGEGGQDRPARADELRLVKVAGDGQRAPVRSGASPFASPAAASVAAQTDELLPAALVAKIVVAPSAAASARSISPTGPRFAVTIPPGTLVQWRTRDPRCGSPFIAVTAAGDSGKVENRWRRGTVAGQECRMVLELIHNSQPITADSFSATFEAGPAAKWKRQAEGRAPLILPADFVTDAHGNPVPFRVTIEDGPAAVDGTQEGTVAARTIRWPANTTGQSIRFGPAISIHTGGAKLASGSYQIDGGSYFDLLLPAP